ncbi:ATP-binding protein [Fusibacter sp. JL216-2]|uniref:sensor histidine kinase n=1 Tax=Fusibacter sp. JL216-2 TaxID=3071453 RepID=UPI003D34E3BA
MIKRDRVTEVFFIAAATALMGQVYIHPFNSSFRISLGIVAMTLLILKFEKVPIAITGFISGGAIFGFRVFLDYVSTAADIIPIMNKHIPAAIFYMIVAVMYSQLKIRNYADYPVQLIFMVSISDIMANIMEVVMRQEFDGTSADVVLLGLFIAGFVRAFLILILYSGLRFYSVLLLREEQNEKYKEFLLMSAKMKAEIFFLNKSMGDIESAMNRSYSIYSELKNDEVEIDQTYISHLKGRLLNLSKDIHEIKKDSQRVISGMESLLPDHRNKEHILIGEVLEIIQENTKRYVKALNKDIEIVLDIGDDMIINDYHSLISVLNNLINNAIESIEKTGFIHISQRKEGPNLVFEITDNGSGIKPKDLQAIFKPGFSTKFDKKTGRMSTGIGLTHVKELVESYYKGQLYVESETEKGTMFKVYIPIKNIQTSDFLA